MIAEIGNLELNRIQHEIVQALINEYKIRNSAIRAEDVARSINRNPGTVRNQMQILKTMGVVEGTPGPKGGYWPTARAFEILEVTKTDVSMRVPVTVNDKLIGSAEELNLTSLSHPDICQATAKILGDVKLAEVDDGIIIGPTPVNRLIVYGTVIGREDGKNKLIINIDRMEIMNEETL